MRAQGASYREIMDSTQLYSNATTLSTVFRNETYLGIRKCGDIETHDAHEPLVSQEL
jgi:hypothetical protein